MFVHRVLAVPTEVSIGHQIPPELELVSCKLPCTGPVCQSFSWGDETRTALLTPDREPMTDHGAFLWSLQKCLFKPFFQFYFMLVIEPSACLANTLPLAYVLCWLLLIYVYV